MKKTRLVISLLVISFLLFSISLFAAFDSTKPFAGKFKGNVNQAGTVYQVIYTLDSDVDGNITGTADTYLNGQLVLPVTVSGSVNTDEKTADITLTGTLGMTPSDSVRITLIGNGKQFIRMQYLNENNEPLGKKVKYKRFNFDPDKPFAGKFKGNVNQAGTVYQVIYTLDSDVDGNITGTADTYLNGQLVLPVTVSGSVNTDEKTADITLTGTLGMTPSDSVRITLIGNGKEFIRMQYLNENNEPFGAKVKYKRSNK